MNAKQQATSNKQQATSNKQQAIGSIFGIVPTKNRNRPTSRLNGRIGRVVLTLNRVLVSTAKGRLVTGDHQASWHDMYYYCPAIIDEKSVYNQSTALQQKIW